MTLTPDSALACAEALLLHYGFEMGGYKAEELVAKWHNDYQANWVRLGVIEALYQGRYKSISVEQILASWNRRGQVMHHFNHEFERLICRKFPQNLADGLTNQAEQELTQESKILEIADCDNLTHNCSSNTPTASGQESAWNQTLDDSTQSVAETPASPISLVTPVTPPSALSLSLAPEPELESKSLVDTAISEAAAEQHNNSPKVNYEADWSRWEAGKRPINQFTPPPDISDFYLKLKSVALQREDLEDLTEF